MIPQKLLLVLVLVVCVSSTQHHDYLKHIQSDDFQKVVLDSAHVWLIHNADSGEDALGELEKVAEALGGVFHVGVVRGAGVVAPGKTYFFGDQKEEPVEYTGVNKLTDLVKFVLTNTKELIDARSMAARHLKEHQEYLERESERANKEATQQAKLREKSDTLLLTTSTFQNLLKSREPLVVNIYVANCSECIALNKEWQGVSSELKGLVKSAKLNLTEHPELEQTLKLKDFPVVWFYPAGVKKIDGAVAYTGTKKKFSLVEWVTQNNQKNSGKSDLQQLTPQSYKDVCKGGKGTCVIIFLQNTSDQELMKSLSSLPGNYLKKPISFFYALKEKQSAFANQFGIETYPNVLMTYCHRKTFWKLDELDVQKLEDAVGEVLLGNRNNFVKYKFEEVVV